MGCCSLKVLSLISAWFHVVFTLLGFVLCVGVLSFSEPDFGHPEWTDAKMNYIYGAFIFACVILAISFIMNVLVIVGIHKSRPNLMAAFIYVNIIMIIICVIAMIGQFIAQLVRKEPLGDVFLNLLFNFIGIGLEVLFFSPIFLMYRRLRKGPILPEHHGLSNNEPVNKPMYGGHI